ncbi:MAG: hypothetical protein R3C56_35975 [Pirellulaceae bacterium]
MVISSVSAPTTLTVLVIVPRRRCIDAHDDSHGCRGTRCQRPQVAVTTPATLLTVPWLALPLVKLTPVGRLSVTLTLVAVEGPRVGNGDHIIGQRAARCGWVDGVVLVIAKSISGVNVVNY